MDRLRNISTRGNGQGEQRSIRDSSVERCPAISIIGGTERAAAKCCSKDVPDAIDGQRGDIGAGQAVVDKAPVVLVIGRAINAAPSDAPAKTCPSELIASEITEGSCRPLFTGTQLSPLSVKPKSTSTVFRLHL
jgi:hypothetical protein